MSRQQLFVIGVLAVFAALTQWLLAFQRDQEAQPKPVITDRSDYTLQTFNLRAMDKKGVLSFELTAPSMARNPKDESMAVKSPTIWVEDRIGRRWDVRADTAWVRGDGDLIKLLGGTEARHTNTTQAGENIVILTNSLNLLPNEKTLNTQDRVTIERTGSILMGLGLSADLNTKSFVIPADVKARFIVAPRR
jgi:lipopolysaccharide export system protein LptC